jgi:hypothetical protein
VLPGFFHQRSIVLIAPVSRLDSGELRADADAPAPIRVVFKGAVPDGPSEIRGEFWDVGRMTASDPRLVPFDVRATFGFDPESGWPRPGQVRAIIATAIAAARPAPSASVTPASAAPSRRCGRSCFIPIASSTSESRSSASLPPERPGRPA